MVRKIACEKKHEVKDFKISIGTMDRKNPWIFYVELNTFIKKDSCVNNEQYDRLSAALRKHLKKQNFGDIVTYDDKTIIDVDIANIASKLGTNPYLNIKAFYVQKERDDKAEFKTIYPTIYDVVNNDIINFVNDSAKSVGLTICKQKK